MPEAELKFFFQGGIAGGAGGMVSSVSVKKMIQDLLVTEDSAVGPGDRPDPPGPGAHHCPPDGGEVPRGPRDPALPPAAVAPAQAVSPSTIVDTESHGPSESFQAMPRGNQLARQWRLLQLLDRPAGITVDEAAREPGCVVRTIWRDLNVLQDAGFPILAERAEDGRGGLWKVEESFKVRLPLKLTLSELAALLMSRELLMPLRQPPRSVGGLRLRQDLERAQSRRSRADRPDA